MENYLTEEYKIISNIIPKDIISYVITPYVQFYCLDYNSDGYEPAVLIKYNIINIDQCDECFQVYDQFGNILRISEEFWKTNFKINIRLPKTKFNVYFYSINNSILKLLKSFNTFMEATNYISKHKISTFINEGSSNEIEFFILSNEKFIKCYSLDKPSK